MASSMRTSSASQVAAAGGEADAATGTGAMTGAAVVGVGRVVVVAVVAGTAGGMVWLDLAGPAAQAPDRAARTRTVAYRLKRRGRLPRGRVRPTPSAAGVRPDRTRYGGRRRCRALRRQ